MLPKCVLVNPPGGGRSHWRDTLKLVQSCIQKCKDGKFIELWDDVIASTRGLRARSVRSKSKVSSDESRRRSNAERARRAVADGQYKKALQSLTSMGLASHSTDVFNEMSAKHPQADPPLVPEAPSPPPIQVSMEQVVGALRSFPTGSAPGPSALRANHLKEAIFCPPPTRANHTLLCLTRVVNLLCAGKAPHDVAPYLCGASLLPCKKKDGGQRPIAVGEVIRRLTSRCVARVVLSEALHFLSPLQVGVGLPGVRPFFTHECPGKFQHPCWPPIHPSRGLFQHL